MRNLRSPPAWLARDQYSTDHDSVNRAVDHGDFYFHSERLVRRHSWVDPSGNLYCLHRFMETHRSATRARIFGSLVMIVIGMLVLYMDHRMVGARKSFVTVAGRAQGWD